MKNFVLLAALLLGLVAAGCGSGGGDPAANADPAPVGAPPSTTPTPSSPGATPSGPSGNAPRDMGRN